MLGRLLVAAVLAGLAVGVWFLGEWWFSAGESGLHVFRLIALLVGAVALARALTAIPLRRRPVPTLLDLQWGSRPESFSGRFMRYWREPTSY